MTDDFYRMLNLPQKATSEEIHHAYRVLALRYHPDRNSQEGADAIMASINRAYEVLREPERRAAYDGTQCGRTAGVDDTVLDAARDMLLKRSWTLVQENAGELVLRNGSHRVHAFLTDLLDSATFDRFHQRSSGLCAALAVRVEPPLRIPPRSAVVIDLLHSRIYGGDLPESAHKELFKPFLL